MTEQEAKIQIQSIPSKIWEQLSQSDNEAIEIAFKSLEKQIAKKVVKINIPNTSWCKSQTRYECPVCNKINNYRETDFCVLCGQKLDWGNEDAE